MELGMESKKINKNETNKINEIKGSTTYYLAVDTITSRCKEHVPFIIFILSSVLKSAIAQQYDLDKKLYHTLVLY